MYDHKCTKKLNHSKIKCEEKNRKFILINPEKKTLYKIEVDDCYIKGESSRCDFLLVSQEIEKAYFVELKGEDIRKAFKQISSTIDHFKQDLSGFNIQCRIISTKSKSIKMKNDGNYLSLLKKIGGTQNIIIRTNYYEETLKK